jgi:hypothetical protein
MNDRRNPCGGDLIVFGNSFYSLATGFWTNGDPNASTITGTLNTEPGVVSVSQDGVTWSTFTSSSADTFPATLGRVYDPSHPDTTLGAWTQWWSVPTDPTLPLRGSLLPATFAGLTVAQAAQLYGRSAGGTPFDIGQLGLPWIQYVKIENPAGSGRTPEIDAISDVAPSASPADLDCDGFVTQNDLDLLRACRTGPAVPIAAANCARMDFDGDNDIDQDDFGLFQRCYTGNAVPASADCMEAP